MSSVTDRLGELVEDAVERLATGEILGETIFWDVVGLPPQPQINQGQDGPVHLLSLIMKGAIIGTEHRAGGLLVQAHNLTQDLVDQVVRQGIEELNRARSASLAPQGESGQEQPQSLILPS